MAFWCRIRYSKLNSLSSRLRRSYFQVPDIKLVNSISGRNITQVSRKTNPFFRHRSSEVYDTVRFFAAPVQAKPKVEARGPKGPRINEQITSKFIRLVVDEGHAIVSRHEALERAKKLKLDLVEVQRDANPPVCKIIDYHREKYKKQVKEKERSKAKSEVTLRKGDCKEVRFSGKTEQKDLQMKADMVKRLMEKGYRVRCMAMGTEDQDLGGLLARLSALIEEFAFVESGPRVERRQAYVIVRHIKFGPSKKGSSKKATNTVGTTGNVVPEATIVPATLNSAGSIPSAELIEDESSESGLETEDKFFIDEADSSADSPINTADRDNEANNTAWSLFDDGDEFEKVFDFDNNQNGVGLSAADGTMDGAAVTTAQQENVDAAALHPQPVPGTIRSPEPLLGGESGCRSSNPVSRLQPNSIKSSSPESHLFSGSFTSSLGQNSNVTRGSGVVDIGRVGSQVPNQGNHGWQRQTVSDISPTAEHKQFGSNGSFRKEKFPSTDETQKHTDLRRVGLQFTSQGNQGRQQQPILNNSPSEQKQFGIDASSKNVQHPSTDETQKHTEPGGVGPQFTIHGNQGRQQQPIWNNSPSEQKEFGINASSKNVQHPSTDAAQKHGSSQPCSPTSPAPGYGIFSTSEPTTPRKENAGMDVKVDPRKSKHLSENPPDLKPPTSNVENRQRSDASTSRPGGWGVFSKEGPSVNNSRVSDTEIRAER